MKKTQVIFIILILTLSGCGGKDKVKLSADYLLTTEAIETINVLKTAYQGKDIIRLKGISAPEIADRIAGGLYFDSAELSFAPRTVRIKDQSVMVNTNWQGTWIINNNTFKNRGIAVFVFEGSPLKLVRIDGDNPFLIPLARD